MLWVGDFLLLLQFQSPAPATFTKKTCHKPEKHSSIVRVMKRIIYIISLSVIIISLTHLTAYAVTDKEMEQARTIAALAYLRYANDGSGYLDAIHVKTIAELEKNLKQKEKENIKVFKAIPVPSDYKTWDKQKLVEYWGVKAFTTPGLLEKGRIGRNRAKKNINAMTVTPPSQEVEKPVSPASEVKPDPVAPAVATAEAPKTEAKADSIQQALDKERDDSIAATAIAQAEAAADALAQEDPQLTKADNHTWVYIVILCVLIGVVCALVIFASNVMKRNEEESVRKDLRVSSSSVDSAAANATREKFAATLAAKNEEIKNLSKKIESVNAQNATLKSNMENLTAEIASLRSRLADANKKIIDMQNAVNVVASAQPALKQPEPQQAPLRTIYLGRVNAKGIFVRADRTLSLGNSIYRLDTTDGYAGSFRVANDPTVWEMALLSPQQSLAGGCAVQDINNTVGMTKIVNDSAGTAIFEGGCWKVIRKAKVHYE